MIFKINLKQMLVNYRKYRRGEAVVQRGEVSSLFSTSKKNLEKGEMNKKHVVVIVT